MDNLRNYIFGMMVFSCLCLTAGSAAAAECGGAVDGFAALADNAAGKVIVVGEWHGTNETPAAFADLVCLLVARHERVLVALEFPREMTESFINPYLEAEHAEAGRALVEDSGFWTDPEWQDGRRSVAMLHLLDALRRLVREDGSGVTVIGFDMPSQGEVGDRDLAMAEQIVKMRAGHNVVAVLTGNVHASKAPLRFGERTLLPMASHLPADETISLNAVGVGEGEAWNCRRDGCGLFPYIGPSGEGVPSEPQIIWQPHPEGRYNGTLYLAPFTAAPPASVSAREP